MMLRAAARHYALAADIFQDTISVPSAIGLCASFRQKCARQPHFNEITFENSKIVYRAAHRTPSTMTIDVSYSNYNKPQAQG